MVEQFTRISFHKKIVEDVFATSLGADDAMLVFALLHTHQINLAGAVIKDAVATRRFAAITQRHCAECLAYCWRGHDDERRDYTHWYWKWNTDWSYERIDGLSGAQLARFNELKRNLESHPAIDSLSPEGD